MTQQTSDHGSHTPGQFDPSMFTQAIDRVVGEYRAAWRKGKSHSFDIVKQAEQYARLLAAAPSMLEALVEAEAVINSMPQSYGFEYDVLKSIRAAIRAAKGESV